MVSLYVSLFSSSLLSFKGIESAAGEIAQCFQNAYCFFQRMQVQFLVGSSQLPATPDPGYRIPSSDFQGDLNAYEHTDTRIYIQTHNLKFLKNVKNKKESEIS